MQQIAFIISLCLCLSISAQTANYVNNGGFENLVDCNLPGLSNAYYWDEINKNTQAAGVFHYCSQTVPYHPFGFQYPRSSMAFALTTIFCHTCDFESNRTPIRNTLKFSLVKDQTYCVRFYVSISENSSYSTDAFAAFFGNKNIDTIKKNHVPLTYLNPQIQNPTGNFIIDTLNWVAVSGTFTAKGDEIYMVIGNFKSNQATNKILINPNNLPMIGADVCIDNVSCIPIDLPAYAGPNKSCVPGDSVYLGRPRDVEIDESCVWYQLPGMQPLDTAAGIYVKPVQTTTYVVKQQLWCSGVKYDTVVVYKDWVGLNELKVNSEELLVYPSPASDFIELKTSSLKIPVSSSLSKNSFSDLPGLYTSLFIPTSYLYAASLKKASSCVLLPGSIRSNNVLIDS